LNWTVYIDDGKKINICEKLDSKNAKIEQNLLINFFWAGDGNGQICTNFRFNF
jgi:hypothetical protein